MTRPLRGELTPPLAALQYTHSAQDDRVRVLLGQITALARVNKSSSSIDFTDSSGYGSLIRLYCAPLTPHQGVR